MATKKIPFPKPQGICSSMVNIGIYFDNPNSFMAPLKFLKSPLKAPYLEITLWQQQQMPFWKPQGVWSSMDTID